MDRCAACRHSFDVAWAPVGDDAALPEAVVTGPRTLLTGCRGKTDITEGAAVKDSGLPSEVYTFEERDRLLSRFLKKSLAQLAILGSSDKPIRLTYTPFVQQATALVAAFTQQLAHFEAMQRKSKLVLADILLESQAILAVVEDCDDSAGF